MSDESKRSEADILKFEMGGDRTKMARRVLPAALLFGHFSA